MKLKNIELDKQRMIIENLEMPEEKRWTISRKKNLKQSTEFLMGIAQSSMERIYVVMVTQYQLDKYHIAQIGQRTQDFQSDIYLVNRSTNQNIGVEDISSGEKTLLSLALMIYKQKKGGTFSEVLLLDEIDGNLHPSMIQQLLNVLENVFIKNYGMKVILVTHSPTTIALAPDASVSTMYREIWTLTNDCKSKIRSSP